MPFDQQLLDLLIDLFELERQIPIDFSAPLWFYDPVDSVYLPCVANFNDRRNKVTIVVPDEFVANVRAAALNAIRDQVRDFIH